MSPSVHTRLLNAEEFFLHAEPANGSQQELVRGEIITMAPPGGMHGVCCINAGWVLKNYTLSGHGGIVTSNDTGVITSRNPDSVRGPDVAYWSKGRLNEVPVGYVETAPDLIVEVLSPGNSRQHIVEKLGEYLDRGVRMIWVIAPEDRTVTIYRTLDEGRLLHESATITGDDVLPGLTCRVSDLLP